jgi:hypothetical protein
MASSTLDQLAAGSRVFLDASIFIYHFTGSSLECRQLLEACESGLIEGFTSVTAVAEVAHRLMTIEAVAYPLAPLKPRAPPCRLLSSVTTTSTPANRLAPRSAAPRSAGFGHYGETFGRFKGKEYGETVRRDK